MISARELLQRFRRSLAPGAAAAVGVPAEPADRRLRELAPVFEALDRTLDEADRIRAEARAEAERRRASAAEATHARLSAAARTGQARRSEILASAREDLDRRHTEWARTAAGVREQIRIRAEASRERDLAEVLADARRSVAALARPTGNPDP